MQRVFEENIIPQRDLHEDDEKDIITAHDDDDDEEDRDDEYDEDDEGEFSFMSFGGELTDTSLISAEDAFVNGQIKPIFPLFNQQLVISDHENLSLHEHEELPKNPSPPPVKKIFVQTTQKNNHHHKEIDRATTSSSESDVISGPYCDLSSRKVVEVTPSPSSSSDTCKKSNSTGFSKIWRFKDFVGRSNSDGRDAFVFLSEAHAPTTTLKKIDEERAVADKSTGKVKKVNRRGGGGKKTASYSAHEVYMRSKVKEDNKKRSSSYLPYKPELMGFFTNVNGGLTKNVHPY